MKRANGTCQEGSFKVQCTFSFHTFHIFRDENEVEMIPDENAEKPTGWLDDEPELIADPDAEKPKDW